MSDQPPSGSTEPVPPASSGAPADPTPSTPPAEEPAPTPGHADRPATLGRPAPARPVEPAPAMPSDQPVAPGPAGYSTPPGQWAPSYGPVPPGWTGQTWAAYPGQPQGWDGGYPGHPPVPGQPYGWYPGLDPDDPLVTPPYAGVGGWFARCTGALRRGWRQLLPIMLLTQGVPAAVLSVLSVALAPSNQFATGPDGAPILPDGYFTDFFALYGAVLLAALLFGPLQSAGWAAGTWVVARQAAGEPVGVGAAFRYGWRRALGLWGWTIVATLLVTVGACLCVLPGIYAGCAVALFGPVYLFERQEPIGRAFRMFHRRFGTVLGRVALVAVALVVAAVLDGVIGAVSQLTFGADPMAAPGTAVGAVALAVLGTLLAVPTYLAQLVGLVAAYAEQRATEGPVNAARLAAELG